MTPRGRTERAQLEARNLDQVPARPAPNRPHKRKPKFEPVIAHIYANLPAWCHGQGEEAIGALDHRGGWREPEYGAAQYRNGIHAFIREAHYDDNWSPDVILTAANSLTNLDVAGGSTSPRLRSP